MHSKGYLYSIKPLDGLRLNIAVDDDGKSFWVLKIKVREKLLQTALVTLRLICATRGSYVNIKQMNELMNNPSTILVDMRNHYEYEVGHFAKAIEVPSDTFRDQLPMAVDMLKRTGG